MKLISRLAFALLLSLPMTLRAQVSQNMSLLSNWDNNSLPVLSGIVYNEVFGWTDSLGREYAILGSLGFTYFIDVTNPAQPVVRDSVIGRFNGCIHRDYKTYRHYCYGVGDEGNSSLQIIDMSYLPDSVHVVYDNDAFFQRCHNVFIDTVSGRLYTAGANTQINGTIILDLASNPENPPLLASLNLGLYTHDMYVRGDTAYMNNGQAGMFIFDFQNPSSPTPLGSLTSYPMQGYNHSSWLTDDGNHLAMCDETHGSPVKMVDVSNIQSPGVVSNFQSTLLAPGSTNSIPHNPLIAGNYLCISYYHDGVQVFDISNPNAPVQYAWYDTDLVTTNYNGYSGAWGVYPYLPSGTILGSDVMNGLFVLRAGFPFPHPLQSSTQVTHVSCFGLSNGSINLSVQGGTGPYQYLWSNGDTTASITGLAAGIYTVTATDRYGYPILDTVQITQPTAILTGLGTVNESCPGNADGELQLNPTGGAGNYTYLWSTGDQVRVLNGLTAGTYTATITDGAGCSVTVTAVVGMTGPLPFAHAGSDTVLCDNSFLLSGLAPAGAQGFWMHGTGGGLIANPNAAQTMVTGLAAGRNTFIWVVNGNPCTNTDTIALYVSAAAFAYAGADTLACGNSLQLNAQAATPGQGAWSAVGGGLAFLNVNDPHTTALGFLPGTYNLIWTVSEAGCSRADTLQVTAAAYPVASFSFGGTGGTVNFTDASQNATSWFWSFGDGGTSTAQHPSHTYAQSGTYDVCLVSTNICGSDTLCRSVTTGTVGLAAGMKPQVKLYPNPASAQAWLQVQGWEGPASVQVFNAQGQVLRRFALADAAQNSVLDLGGLAAGIYSIELHGEGLRWTGKLGLL